MEIVVSLSYFIPRQRQLLPTSFASMPTPGVEAAAQWANPSDILSVLLLIGSSTIQKAIAQQAGDNFLPTPVVFSFGWVPYACLSLMSLIRGDGFLPSPDYPCSVIDVKSRYSRMNQYWVTARILRDFERSWMPKGHRDILRILHRGAGRKKAGLCLSVLQAKRSHIHVRRRDFWWWSGYAIAILQLAIAIIPWALKNNWSIFLITTAGTVLAFAESSLPHWAKELTEARVNRFNGKDTCVLTRGGGWAQHAVLILGSPHEPSEPESSGSRTPQSFMPEKMLEPQFTYFLFLSLAFLWSILLIMAAGVQDDRWYLFAVGTIGMVHTFIIAMVPRSAEHYGLEVEEKCCLVDRKVMRVLAKAEYIYPGVGRALRPVYFPGDLRQDEELFWERAEKTMKERSEASLYLTKSAVAGKSSFAHYLDADLPSVKVSAIV
ncbi:hypothetical protein DL96DRAFT_399395 [Flagelloscypha sp. PMI_526]|nr:hypothetical protein DL96DRAFT_399395 [Flagelloscypha sp. PMI_526]